MFPKWISDAKACVQYFTDLIFESSQGTSAQLYLAHRTYDALGGIVYGISRPAVSSRLINVLVGDEQKIQQLLDGLVPHLTTNEFSKMLRGFRYALTHIINDQPIPYEEMGTKWRVDVISVNDYFESFIHPKKSYAFVDESISKVVIQLPKLKFPQILLQQYFDDLNNEQIFTGLDDFNKATPAWVIRIKKLWNLLFLVEKIFTSIERHRCDLASPENLADFNHAYNLLFDLDINILDFFEKINEKFPHELLKEETEDKLWLAKNLGFYLGLTLTQLGSTGNIFSFANQTKEILPHIFAELTLILQKVVSAIATKGRVSVNPKHVHELQKEADKIVEDIMQFLRMQKDKQANFLDIFLGFLDFISKPDRQKVYKFFKYLAQEHQTLCVELMRFIKYEVSPSIIGFFEEFENSMMLEPGSLVFYIENYSQMFFESMVSYLPLQDDPDMQTLYTPNWMMVREYQSLKRLSILEQQKTKLNFELSILNHEDEILERFKILYPYLVKVDSQVAEEIRARLSYDSKTWREGLVSKTQGFRDTLWNKSIQDNWNSLVPKVNALILSQLTQIENQIQLLQAYIESFDIAKTRQVCYFELILEKRISFEDLPPLTQQNILALHESQQDEAITRELIQAHLEKINQWLDTDGASQLFHAEEALIKLADEYFLVQKNQVLAGVIGTTCRHLPGIEMPFNPSYQKSVLLPGKVLKILESIPSNHLSLVLSMETSRFSLKLDEDYVPRKGNFTLDQLSSEELHQYSIAWREKKIKIERAQKMLTDMIALVNSCDRSEASVSRLKYYYFNLQGVFQHFLSPQAGQPASADRFSSFNGLFIENLFETDDLLKTCQEILENLRQEFENSDTRMQLINKQYEAQYKNEKHTQFQIDKKDPRAGYLIRSKKYSAFFRDKINELHAFIEKNGSSVLKEMLTKHQNVIWTMYDKRHPFPEGNWKSLPKNIIEICYLHNTLFYLEKLCWRFERQKKYALSDTRANYELVSRIYSIIDFFTFFNFAFYRNGKGAIVESLKQFLRFEPIVKFSQRYSQVYDLRDVEESAYLSRPLTAKQMMVDMFTDELVSDYVFHGKIDGVLLQKIDGLMEQQDLIYRQWTSLHKIPIYRAHLQEIKRVKNKIDFRKKGLNQLKTDILNTWKRASYAIQNQLLQNLELECSQLEANDALMKNRYKLILRLVEKSQQGLSKELSLPEKITLKLLSGKTLNAREERYVQAQIHRQDEFDNEQSYIRIQYETLLMKGSIKKYWDDIFSAAFKAQLKVLSMIISQEPIDIIIKKIAGKILERQFRVDDTDYVFINSIYTKSDEEKTPQEKLLISLVYKAKDKERFYCHIQKLLEQVEVQSPIEKLIIKITGFRERVDGFQLEQPEIELLREIFVKPLTELNANELVLREIFQYKSRLDQFYLQPYPRSLSSEELLFKKIVTRKRLGLSLELNQREKDQLTHLGSLQEIFSYLIEEHDKSWRLKQNPIDALHQYLIELYRHPIHYPFKPVIELTFQEILNLPQVQLLLMRSDIYQAYLNYSNEPIEVQRTILNQKLKEVFTKALQDLRVIEWRHQKLKNIHLNSKKLIAQYELVQQGQHGFMRHHLISMTGTLASNLRESIVYLKEKSELHISSIKDTIVTPFIAEFDGLEIQMGLKPGFFTVFLENQCDALIKEFAGQISPSPINCPLILADRLSSLNKRKELIKDKLNNKAHMAYFEQLIQNTKKTSRQTQEKLIIDKFIEKTANFCKLLEGQYQLISNSSLKEKKILYRYLHAKLLQNILQQQTLPARLRVDIFTEICAQAPVQYGNISPRDMVFNQKLISIFSEFMNTQKYHFKKLDELINTLDAYEAYLGQVASVFTQMSERLNNSNLTWYQRLFLTIEYLFKIKMYYASLNLTLIQKKQAIISQLRTHLISNCLAETMMDMDQVLMSFTNQFSNPQLERTLKESTVVGWYPGKFLFQLIGLVLKSLVWILNCFLPRNAEIRLMEPVHLQYHEDIQYILKKTAKDVTFDFKEPLDRIVDCEISMGMRLQFRAS